MSITMHLLTAALLLLSASDPTAVEHRTAYALPLAKLRVESSDPSYHQVRISYADNGESWLITPGDDSYTHPIKDGRQTQIYGEDPATSFEISALEAEQLDRVCKTFVRTLGQFEKDLQHGRWDRCLYLDAYFPRFLKGFFCLYCAARHSSTALPRAAEVPDDAYDISLNSPKTDARIRCWREDQEHRVKLRIMTEELIYQIKRWQKQELDNPRRDPATAYGGKFELAFTLFVKLYFNLGPAPETPGEGKHL